jgi:hypothetical protein
MKHRIAPAASTAAFGGTKPITMICLGLVAFQDRGFKLQTRSKGTFAHHGASVVRIVLIIALLGGFSGIGGSPFYGDG